MKKIKLLILIALLMLPNIVLAHSNELIVGGDTIGIEIKTEGVLVVGTYLVNNENIVSKSGMKAGDLITKVDDLKVSSINDLMNSIDENECNEIKVEYKRNDRSFDTMLVPKMERDICKTGLFIRDSITGIGTLTFIDPKTKMFGALGHEIIERQTGRILDSRAGTIFASEIINISKSSNGKPGEKSARFYSGQVSGNVFKNTNKGIFGVYTKEIRNNNLYKVGTPQRGPAKMLTVLEGREVKEYAINITRIIDEQDTKNLVFEIIDQELLDIAGGIVQGMSGSPIVQGDYIIGAVTHVVVDNPQKGYGIFITTMLQEGER